jgi:hypothetical protein
MGAWQEIVDYTVPSNTTSVVLDDFGTITKDDFYKIVVTLTNATASFNNISFTADSSTATNYHRQALIGDGSTASASRANDSVFTFIHPSQTANVITYMKLSENDRLNYFANTFATQSGTDVRLQFNYATSSGETFTSGITSLTFTGNQTNGLGTGSRIQIYKLAAEKVADITVGSNTTQVDISSLSIDKDSEYLLVSDYVYGAAGNNFDLFVNNNTTLTDYYTQRIQGSGSTASASRDNSARVGYLDSNDLRFLSYGHIKLSNIGAYTSQNYSMQHMGTSSMFLRNDFVSSVAENITSITSINVRSRATNGFGVGTRLQLYKLYE